MPKKQSALRQRKEHYKRGCCKENWLPKRIHNQNALLRIDFSFPISPPWCSRKCDRDGQIGKLKSTFGTNSFGTLFGTVGTLVERKKRISVPNNFKREWRLFCSTKKVVNFVSLHKLSNLGTLGTLFLKKFYTTIFSNTNYFLKFSVPSVPSVPCSGFDRAYILNF